MRLGVAEIGENAVAHLFGDEATVALDQFGAAMMIGGHDAPQVLRVEPCRECGRTHQVTELNRQLAAFGRCGSGLMRSGGAA